MRPRSLAHGTSVQDRIRRHAGGPDQCRANDLLAVAQLDFVRPDGRDFGLWANLDAALAEFLVGVTTKLLAEFGQDVFARMHKHDPKHFLAEIWVKRQRVAEKIVDAGNGFDARKSAAGDNKRQQRRAICTRAFGVSFFQMGD